MRGLIEGLKRALLVPILLAWGLGYLLFHEPLSFLLLCFIVAAPIVLGILIGQAF